MSTVLDDVKAELAAMGWVNLDGVNSVKFGPNHEELACSGSRVWLDDIETAVDRVDARRALAELERRARERT